MTTKILSTLTKEAETRTTCTLSVGGNTALESLTSDFGLKQKQIFDLITSQDIYSHIINTIPASSTLPILEIRKSIVVTKKNLKLLNEVSASSGIQRDIIVNRSFIYLVILLQQAKELQRDQHKKALVALNKLSKYQHQVEKELEGYLDEDDAILTRASKVISVLDNLIQEVQNSIKNGSEVDPDGM